MDERTLVVVIMISAVFALGGLGYIHVFSPLLGNDIYLSPTDSDGGIQLSPGSSCQKVCESGVFIGCERSFEEPVCGLTCKGIVNVGSGSQTPKIGSTLCKYADCVCD